MRHAWPPRMPLSTARSPGSAAAHIQAIRAASDTAQAPAAPPSQRHVERALLPRLRSATRHPEPQRLRGFDRIPRSAHPRSAIAT
jgi:hypothetical protein